MRNDRICTYLCLMQYQLKEYQLWFYKTYLIHSMSMSNFNSSVNAVAHHLNGPLTMDEICICQDFYLCHSDCPKSAFLEYWGALLLKGQHNTTAPTVANYYHFQAMLNLFAIEK